jgi:thiamine-monophosphate kinase
MSGLSSEDELVALLRKLLADDAPGVRLGPGDDAALVELGDHLAVLTTDMMVEGVHFERRTISPTDLGYKALSASVSDVAAMAGSPRFGLVSLGLPTDLEASWVVELSGKRPESTRCPSLEATPLARTASSWQSLSSGRWP